LNLVNVCLIGVKLDAMPEMPECFIGLTDIEVGRAQESVNQRIAGILGGQSIGDRNGIPF
jgi:hypothetical protein